MADELTSYEDLLEALLTLVGSEVVVSISPYADDGPQAPVAIFYGRLVHGNAGGPLVPPHLADDATIADSPFGGEWTVFLVDSGTGEHVGLFVAGEAAFRGGSTNPMRQAVRWLVAPVTPGVEDSAPTVEVDVKAGGPDVLRVNDPRS